jgi:hypothetical protein
MMIKKKMWKVAAAASLAACISSMAHADGPAPGSYQAIMQTKSPGVYGPHLPAADAPAAPGPAGPAPGSYAAIMQTKSPVVYGPHAPAESPQATEVASTCSPGSYAAVMSAKLPPSARPGDPAMYAGCR